MGNLEEIVDSSEVINFRASLKEVTHVQDVPPYNELIEGEKQYGRFTSGSCCVVGNHKK